MLIYIKFQNK